MMNLKGHMPRFTLKMNVSNLSSWKQETLHFSEMIDLRGHMPRFTLKMNVFPICLLGDI